MSDYRTSHIWSIIYSINHLIKDEVSHSLDLEASVEMSSLCVEQEMASIVIKLVTGLQEIVNF